MDINKRHEIIQNMWIKEELSIRDITLKEKYEQFYTPSTIANYMASFFRESKKNKIKVLDPGTGMGSLTIAFILTVLTWKNKPNKIELTLYEIDTTVREHLEIILKELSSISLEKNIELSWQVEWCDFIEDNVSKIQSNSFDMFDYVILNPPYRKLGADTTENKLLLDIGINSANFYAAFVSLAKRLLKKKGELVAITPRSFCNGVYFVPFREDLKSDMRFLNIHLFDSRTSPFRKDEVLQETVIYHCIKDIWDDTKKVNIIHSTDDCFDDLATQTIRLDELIYPNDNNITIRIVKNDEDKAISEKIESLPCSLFDLEIEVSTGPIVGFREKRELLRKEVVEGSVPYLHSNHIRDSIIRWPSEGAKYNCIISDEENMKRLRPSGNYVLVKRMSSKEERRRIVCGVVKGEQFETKFLGFDNKTNYYHKDKEGISLEFAKGLCLYLSSSIVDIYFRVFSGHTQVNAADLRGLKYPSKESLEELGRQYTDTLPSQFEIDELIETIIFSE